ncbi:hypothetical protein CULC22_01970 [Corynebacterium ulcerans BR-AD22]|nr:hypothetical protein CULC22_01970 [Corynebacterium ulcerans BR-AD22]
MLTWEMIAEMNMDGEEKLTEMQDSIREALKEGSDPGPAVAIALVHMTAEHIALQSEMESKLSDVAAYVLGLEARLLQSGLSFAEAEDRILGD